MKYKMTLKATGERGEFGKAQIAYTFKTPEGKVLFQGNDFYNPEYVPEDKDSAISLLGFLTLKPGDTDQDYFKDYTPEQLEFSNSMDCEMLQLIVSDYEEKGKG